MLSFFVMSTSPQITGFATYLDSNSYEETLDLDLAESQIVTWTPEQEFLGISSVKISGSISEETTAQVYLVDGDIEYLVFDTEIEEDVAGFQITGNAVADTASFSIPEEQADITEHSPAELEDISEAEISPISESEDSNESSEAVDSIVQEETDSETLIEEEQPYETPAEETSAEPTIEEPTQEETVEEQQEDETKELQEETTSPEQEQIESITFEHQCVETCDVSLDAKEYVLKVVVSSGDIKIDSITYTIKPIEMEDVTAEINDTEEVNETQANETIILEDRTEETIQIDQVVINQPAKWKKIITLAEPTANVEITVPAEAKNLRLIGKDGFTIKSARIIEDSEDVEVEPVFGLASNESKSNDSVESTEAPIQEQTPAEQQEAKDIRILIEEEIAKVEIQYETEGPTAQETEIVSGKKQITVASEIHYENVLSFTSIPNTPAEAITFYWYEEIEVLNEETTEIEIIIEKRDATYDELVDLTYYDSDEDGLVDYVEWIVPHLSNQTFEIQITVLNVQSYPMVGGNWTVMFETVGQANLTISTVDGTTWSDVDENASEYDLKLLEVLCGNETQNYTWTNESKVFIPNYTCNETGYETSKVLTEGGHYIEFDFGGFTARAQNAASDCHVTTSETMLADVTCPAGFNVTSTGSLETDGFNITVTAGGLHIEAGGDLNITAGSNLSIADDVHINGTLNASVTSADLSFGSLTINAGGIYEATNGTTEIIITGNNFYLNIGGTLNHNSGTFKFTGDGGYFQPGTSTGAQYQFNDVIVEMTADNDLVSVSNGHYLYLAGNLTIVEGKLNRYHDGADTLTVDGDVVIEDGGILDWITANANNEPATFGSLTINDGGTYTATNGTTTVTNNITSNGDLVFNDGIINVTYLILNTTSTLDSNLTVEGNLKIDTDGDLTTNNQTINVTQDISVYGIFNASDDTVDQWIGSFSVGSGAQYTSTTGTLHVYCTNGCTSGYFYGNFYHNNGTVILETTCSASPWNWLFGLGDPHFYNLVLNYSCSEQINTKIGTVYVDNDFTVIDGDLRTYAGDINVKNAHIFDEVTLLAYDLIVNENLTVYSGGIIQRGSTDTRVGVLVNQTATINGTLTHNLDVTTYSEFGELIINDGAVFGPASVTNITKGNLTINGTYNEELHQLYVNETIILGTGLNLTVGIDELNMTVGSSLTFANTTGAGFTGTGILNVMGSSNYTGLDNTVLNLNSSKNITIPHDSSLTSVLDERSISIWFKTLHDNSSHVLFQDSAEDITSNVFNAIWLNENGFIYSRYSASSTVDFDSELGGFNDGAWHNLIVTFDLNAGRHSYYVDTVLTGYANMNGNINFETDPYDILIGAIHKSSSYIDFNGSIGSVAIWNRSLNQSEIIELQYNNHTTLSSSELDGLVSWWEFNESSGTDVYDSQGSNDGIATDSDIWDTEEVEGVLFTEISGGTAQWQINTSDITTTINYSLLSYGNNTGEELRVYNSPDLGNNHGAFIFISVLDTCSMNGTINLLAPLSCSHLEIPDGVLLDTNNYAINATHTTSIYGTLNASGDTVNHTFGRLWITSIGRYEATSSYTNVYGSPGLTYSPNPRTFDLDDGGRFIHGNGTVYLKGYFGNDRWTGGPTYFGCYIAGNFDADNALYNYDHNCGVGPMTIYDNYFFVENTLFLNVGMNQNADGGVSYVFGTDTTAGQVTGAGGFTGSATAGRYINISARNNSLPTVISGGALHSITRKGYAGDEVYLSGLNITSIIDSSANNNADGTIIYVAGPVYFSDLILNMSLLFTGDTRGFVQEGTTWIMKGPRGMLNATDLDVNGTLVIDSGATLNATTINVNGTMNVSSRGAVYFEDSDLAGFTGDGTLNVIGNAIAYANISSAGDNNWTIDADTLTVNPFNWSVIDHGNNTGDDYIYLYDSVDAGNNTGFFFTTVDPADACTFTTSGTLTEDLNCSTLTVNVGIVVDTNNYSITTTGAVSIYGSINSTGDTATQSFNTLTIQGGGSYEATSGATTIAGNFWNYNTFTHNNGTVVFDSSAGSAALIGDFTGSSAFYNINGSGSSYSMINAYADTDIEHDLLDGTSTNGVAFALVQDGPIVTFGTDDYASIIDVAYFRGDESATDQYVYGANESYPAKLYPTQVLDFLINSAGYMPANAHIKWVDVQKDITTPGITKTITLDGNVSFQNIIVSASDTLNTSGYILNATGYNVTYNGNASALNGTIIADVLNVTERMSVTAGQTIDLKNVSSVSHGSLTINSGGTYEATNGTTFMGGIDIGTELFRIYDGGTFIHNDGRVETLIDYGETAKFYVNNATFYDLYSTHIGGGAGYLFIYSPINIINTFTLERPITLEATNYDVILTLGNASQSGTLIADTQAISSQNLDMHSIYIEGASETYLANITSTANNYWGVAGTGNPIHFKWVDWNGPITTDSTDIIIQLDGNCSFQNIIVSAGDTLNTNGYLLNATGYNVTNNNNVTTYNGTIIADVLNVTGALNITSGQTLNLSQTTAPHHNSLNVFSDAIYHTTNETLTVINNATSNGDIIFNNGTISLDTLFINSIATFDSNFTVTGDLQVSAGGYIYTNDKVVSVSSVLGINGTFNATDFENHTYARVRIDDSGTFLATNQTTWITGDLNNSGTFTHSSGVLNMTGTGTLSGLNSSSAVNYLIIDTSAHITSSELDVVYGPDVYGILNASAGTYNMTFELLNITSTGTYHATPGTTTITSVGANNYSLIKTGTLLPNNGTIKLNASDVLNLSSSLSGELYSLELDNGDIVNLESNFNVVGDLIVKSGTTLELTDDNDYNLTVQETFILNGSFDGHDSYPRFGGFWIQDSGTYDLTSEELTLTGTNHELRNDRSDGCTILDVSDEYCHVLNVTSSANIDVYGEWTTHIFSCGGTNFGWFKTVVDGNLTFRASSKLSFSDRTETQGSCNYDSGFVGTGTINVLGTFGSEPIVEGINTLGGNDRNWNINTSAMNVSMNYADVSYGNNTGDNVIFVRNGIDSGNNVLPSMWLFEIPSGTCRINVTMTLGSNLECSKVLIEDGYELDTNGYTITSANYTIVNGTLYGSTADQHLTFLKVNEQGHYNTTTGTTHLTAGGVIDGNLTFEGGSINGTLLVNGTRNMWSNVSFSGGDFIPNHEVDSSAEDPIFYNLRIPYTSAFNANTSTVIVKHNFTNSGGIIGDSAAELNGTEYIYFDTISAMESNLFTFEAWVNPAGAGDRTIFSYHDYMPTQDGFMLQIQDNNTILFEAPLLTPTSVESTAILNNNSYTHVAVVHKSDTVEIYLNGELDTSASVSGSVTVSDNVQNAIGANIQFGAEDPSISEPFIGVIDEVKYWTTALEEHEVRANMFKEVSSADTNYASLIVYTKLDDYLASSFNLDKGGTPCTIKDYNGTVIGSDDNATTTGWVSRGNWSYDTSTMNFTGEGVVSYIDNVTFYNLAVGHTVSETSVFNSTTTNDNIYVLNNLYTDVGIAQFEDMNVSVDIYAGTGSIVGNNLQANGSITDAGATFQNVVNVTYTNLSNSIASSTYDRLILYGVNKLVGSIVANTEIQIKDNQSLYTNFYDINTSKILIGNDSQFNVSRASRVSFNSTFGLSGSAGELNAQGAAYQKLSGAYFDGVDDHINVTESDGLDILANNLSISLWVNTNKTGTVALLSKGMPSGSTVAGYEVSLTHAPTQYALMRVYDGGSLKQYYIDVGDDLNDSLWHNVVYILNTTATATNVHVYVDGTYKGVDSTAMLSSVDNSDALQMGLVQVDGGSDSYLAGMLDDVRIFNRTLLANEVTSIYGLNAVTDGLVVQYEFENAHAWSGSANEVRDSSGNEHNGTALNGAESSQAIISAKTLGENYWNFTADTVLTANFSKIEGYSSAGIDNYTVFGVWLNNVSGTAWSLDAGEIVNDSVSVLNFGRIKISDANIGLDINDNISTLIDITIDDNMKTYNLDTSGASSGSIEFINSSFNITAGNNFETDVISLNHNDVLNNYYIQVWSEHVLSLSTLANKYNLEDNVYVADNTFYSDQDATVHSLELEQDNDNVEFYIKSDSVLNILNGSFTYDTEDLLIEDGSYLNKNWYLDIYVNESGSPAGYTNITVNDTNGNHIFNGTTDVNGYIQANLTEYRLTNSAKILTYYSNYSILAESNYSTDLHRSAIVNMSDNQIVYIGLQDYQVPAISIIQPVNGTYMKKSGSRILLKADINDTVDIKYVNYTLVNSTNDDILNSSVDLSASTVTDYYLEIEWENGDWSELDGNYTLNITVYDNFDNRNENVTEFYVDNTNPVISTQGSSVSPIKLAVNSNITITANVTENNTLAVWANITYSNGESEYINLTQQADPTIFNITYQAKAVGTYDTVYLHAEDRAGNLDGPTPLSTFSTYMLAHIPETFDVDLSETSTFELGSLVSIHTNVTDPLNFTDVDVCLVNVTNKEGYVLVSEANMTTDTSDVDAGIVVYEYNLSAIPYNVTSIGDWQIDVFCNTSNSYNSTNTTNITAVYTQYPAFDAAGANLADFGIDVATEIYANITGIINETDSSVTVNVSWPNGNLSTHNMTLANYGVSSNKWNVTFNGSNEYNVLGGYNATIYVTDYNGNKNATNITFEVYETTTVNLTLTPSNLVVSTINASSGYEYNLTAVFNNTGNATALSVAIDSLGSSVPDGWTFEPQDGTVLCENLRGDNNVRVGENCTKIYTVSIPANEVSGEHDFTFYSSYNDLNGAPANPTEIAYVTISSNPILLLNETEVNGTVHHNVHRELNNNILLTSAGNDYIENITFLNQSGVLNNSWINFSYSIDRNATPISQLISNSTTEIYINASIPVGYPAGNYSGTYLINASNTTCLSGYDERCYATFDLNIEVPENRSWESPLEVNTTVYDNTSGNITAFNITNFGNINMTWVITDLAGNASSLITLYNTSTTVDKEYFGTNNYTHTIHGDYAVPLTQQPGIYEYILQITNGSLNPGEINTTLNLIVLDNVVPIIVSTSLSTSDNENRTDFNQSMQIEGAVTDNINLSEMWALVETPNGSNYTVYLTESPIWIPDLTIGLFNSTDNNGSLILIENEYIDTSDPEIIWHFNNSAGENTEDASDNDYLATVNGATFATGKFNQSLSFDGTNDYVNSSDLSLSTDDRTIALWVKMNDKSQGVSIISKYLDFEINQTSSLSWSATVYDGAGASTSVTAPNGYENNVWHHIVLTADADNNIELYIDGTSRDTDTYTNWYGVSSPIEVGRSPSGSGYFNGSVDEVLIFERILTADEIHQLSGDYTQEGNYTTIMYNASSKTFWSNVYWSGELPEGTNLTVQFQTSDNDTDWSEWSSEFNDSGSDLTSIGNATVIKAKINLYTNDTHYTPTLDVFNVTYGSGYVYRGNYTPIQAGTHNVTVYANDSSNNIASQYAGYFETLTNTTAVITVVLNDTTYVIDSYGNVTVTTNNTGNATMYGAELQVYADSGVTVSGNNSYACGDVIINTSCSSTFELYLSPQLIDLATYFVYADVNWTDADGTLASETASDSFEATAPTDAWIHVIPTEISDSVDHGYSGTPAEFNLSVTGGESAYVEDILFDIKDVNSDWINFSETTAFTMLAGTNKTIHVTLGIPSGTAAGDYVANITAYGSGCVDDLTHCNTTVIYNITVKEENNNWNVSPLGVNISEAATGSQSYYPINLTNDGNVLLQLQLTTGSHSLTCFDPYDQDEYCDGADCVCNYLPRIVDVNQTGSNTVKYLNITKQNSTVVYLKYQTMYVGQHTFSLFAENLVNTTIQTIPINITSLGPPPDIENVTAVPSIHDVNGTFNANPYVNLTANVTQDGSFGITNAGVNLTLPSAEIIELYFESPGGVYNEGIWVTNYTELNDEGTYIVTVWAINDNGATSTNTTTFFVANKTTIDLNVTPSETSLNGVDQDSSETFEVNLTVNNTGNGTSSNTINIYAPTGFTSSPTAISAFTLNRSQSSIRHVNITAAAGLQSGFYGVNFTNTWSNPDGTTNETNGTLTITVSEVRQLDINESSLSINLYPDESEEHNFTVSSTGTASLLSIDMACVGDCSYFNYTFDPTQIASLVPGSSETVTLNITPKNDTLAATYNLNFTATAFDNVFDSLPTIIIVEEHKNWTISPTTLTRSVGNDTSGVFGTVTISNTGDIVGTYNISLLNNSELFFNISEEYAQVTIQAGSSSEVPINYTANATGTFNATFSVDTDATLAQQNVSLFATVVPLVVDLITPTQSNVSLVDPEDTILIWVNISNGTSLTTDVDWSVEIDSTSTTVNSNSFDTSVELWKINSSVPDLVPGIVQLEVTGAHAGISVSDVEISSINITDITVPTIGNATWPYTTSGNNVTISADIDDDSEVNNAWIEITLVNGSLKNYTMSNVSAFNWTVNVTNVTDVGDYDIVIFANDSWGNIGNETTWFEVRNETAYTFSGVITDVKSAVWNTTFDFRKPGTSYSLYNLSTNFSTGAYSEQVHRRIYDIYITTNNNSVLLRNVSIYEDKSDTIDIYGFNSVDLTLNDVGYGPYSKLYFSSSLGTDAEELIMRYDEPIAAKNLLGIYKCNSWNYDDTNPLCDNYNFTRYSNTTVNLTSWVVIGSMDEITGPYLLSHFICGDQVCDEDYGESSYTCSRDCGGVVSDDQQDLFDEVTAAASSGGGGGGGGASIGSIKSLLSTTQQEIDTDTDILQVVLTPGESRVVKIGIKNNKFDADTVELSIDGSNIFPFMDILDKELEIAGKDINYTDIKFSTSITTLVGTYTGNLIIESADSSNRQVPVVLTVVDPDMPLLDVVVTPLTKRVAPGDQLMYKVEILNMGETERVDIVNNHIIREIETGAVILKLSETIAVDERLTYTKAFNISESTREGQYQIELVAKYADGERTALALETFEVTSEPIVFSAVKRLSKSWITYILIVLFVLLVYYGPILYNLWKARRKQQQRYVFPLDKKFLPKKEENSVSVGRIAETQDPSYVNLLDLKVHMLCAGATGGGKSVSAQIVVEEALKKGVAVIVFDPTFQWSGFINKSSDANMMKLYDKFGMKQEEAAAFNTKLYQVEDPDMKLDITKHIVPGQITVFGMNKLTASKLDVFVKNTIKAVFDANLPTTSKLKLLLVYDEIHRVLPKYGGSKAYLYLEKGVREFRKWGVGMVMISQVISDFKEAIATNIGTEIQMRTKYKGDLKRVEDKYGKEYSVALPRLKVGTGMVQNSEYNKGRPYFVEFRPLLHSTDKVTDAQYNEMKKLEGVLYQIGTKLVAFKKAGKKIDDVKVEFDLARDKLKSGNTRMVKSYIESIIEKLKKMQ